MILFFNILYFFREDKDYDAESILKKAVKTSAKSIKVKSHPRLSENMQITNKKNIVYFLL